MAGPSRVGEVRLRARLPATLAADVDAVRARLERETVVAVLEEVERRLHAALGVEAIIHVRHLALSWQLGVDELGDAAVHARLADALVRDLSAAVDAQSDAARLRPADPTLVVFMDAHHRAAAALAEAADERPPHWALVALPAAPALWASIVAAGAPALSATIAWLARMERVEAALALADEPSLEAVVAAAPSVAGVVAVIRARRAARSAVVATARAVEAAVAPPAAPSTQIPAVAVADASPPPTASPPDLATAAANSAATIHSAAQIDPVGPPPSAQSIAASALPRDPATLSATAAPSVTTTHAGLFFLVGRVLEIELAEQMWAAGIDEGRALTAVAHTLIDPDDPAAAWFGGDVRETSAPRAPFTCTASAAAEVRHGVTHALGLRLVRFGIARTPAALDAELSTLAAAWPAPPTLDPSTRALVTHGAAALALITAARLQQPPSLTLLRAVCRRAGALALSDDALHVILPAAALDLDLRRAGLDHNPGHVPWLRRRVVIEYVGLESL